MVFGPAGSGLSIDPFEKPMGCLVGEAQENPVRELEIPLDALPPFDGIPPLAGEGKRAVHDRDGAGVRTGEESEGTGKAISGLGSDMDRERRSVSLQRQGCGCSRSLFACDRGKFCPTYWRMLRERASSGGRDHGARIPEFEAVRLVGVDGVRGAEAACPEKGLQTSEGICELVGVSQGALKEVVLGFPGQGWSEGEGPGCHRRGSAHGIEMAVEDPEKSGWIAGGFGEP